MVKSELVDEIAKEHSDWAFKDVVFGVNFILETMSTTLVDGGRIEIRSFGSFQRSWLDPRNAHNPKTGEKVVTLGKYRARFRAAKSLRHRIDKNKHLPIDEGSKRSEEEAVS